MKKILTLSIVLAISTGASFAASTYGTNLKNAIKQDVQSTKEAIKKDADNRQNANNAATQAKKEQKIKQIDAKLDELNKEMQTVKNDKNLSETERTLKVNSLQRQINFYNKQKEALK